MLTEKYNNIQFNNELMRISLGQECDLEGERQALIKLNKEFYYDYYKNNPEQLIKYASNDRMRQYKKDYFQTRKNSKCRYKYAMITVAPYKDVELKEFMKKVNKALSKTYIKSSVSCIEWTHESSEDNGGMHLHTRIEIQDKDPYRIKKEFYNTFKNLTEPQCVKINYSNDPEAFIDYIKGFKKGVEKDCVPISKSYRKLFNIPDTF